jgi:gas vesicle protein
MSTGNFLLGVLAGSVAGAAFAILFAPEKGSVTRKKIMEFADDLSDGIKEKIIENLKMVTNNIENLQQEITNDAKNLVENTKNNAKENYKEYHNSTYQQEKIEKW